MIGLIANIGKPAARKVLRTIMHELTEHKMPFALEAETAAAFAEDSPALPLTALAKKCKMLVILGGDGTLLRVVHSLGEPHCPVFGINLGSLGFLAAAAPSEISRVVSSIQEKNYRVSQRTLLRAQITKTRKTFHALNDVVMSRGARPELLKLAVAVDSHPLTSYNADGLIVATPTGSTAYSLSAGGPILAPECGCFVVTPICPHTLTNRSTVVSDTSTIEVTVAEKGHDVVLTVDGQDVTALKFGDTLRITRSSRRCPLATLHPFTKTLCEKLNWRGSYAGV